MQSIAEGYETEITSGLSVDAELRASAALNYAAGNLTGALAKWQYQDRAPAGITEASLVTDGLAEKGDDAALEGIAAIRRGRPIEADVMLARLRFRQGKLRGAAEVLARALVAYREDPWPSPALMRRSLDLVVWIVRADPSLAPVLATGMAEPFAVRSLEGARLVTRLWLESLDPDPSRCAIAWHDLEPWVPWDAESLTARRDCYHRTKDPRAAKARAELGDFIACGAGPSWLGCL
jgi:hypothetical protein